MVYALIAAELALLAVLVWRRRCPVFCLWLVLAAWQAWQYQASLDPAWWLAWARGEQLVIVMRLAIVVEAFVLLMRGVAPGLAITLAGFGACMGATLAGAMWGAAHTGFAHFVDLRTYGLVALAAFLASIIAFLWMRAADVPRLAMGHALVVLVIVGRHAVSAVLDRFIATGESWRLVTDLSIVAAIVVLSWSAFNNFLEERDPRLKLVKTVRLLLKSR